MGAMPTRPPIPYFREGTPDLPPASRPLYPGQLSPEQLRRSFRFLLFDYQATIVGTAALPNAERFELVRDRLAAYSDALADALGDGCDDAAILLHGRRAAGGGR